MKFDVAYDNSTFVGFLMDNMVEELVIAVLLTGLVVLFFLGNVRGTLISVITIPISLGMALLAMVPLGMTLNSSTLIGLLLSIGRLVDDSIIDIHSIERHLRMGKSPKEAAIDGISEVRLAVLAITFMLCVALLPLAFSGGIVQLMFEGIVWAIILALLSSALVSFTLTALLAANLFRRTAKTRRNAGTCSSAGSSIRRSGSSSVWKLGTRRARLGHPEPLHRVRRGRRHHPGLAWGSIRASAAR